MPEAAPAGSEPDKDGKSGRRLSVAQIRDSARVVMQGLRLGKSPAQIVSKLRERGLTFGEAQGIEDHVRLAYQRSQMRIATMLMVSGVLWSIASILTPVLLPGPKATRYSLVIFIAAVFQWLYGWQRRRRAQKIRSMKTDQPGR
jgi:hypothetical protein